jgi:cell division septum initiation protein DivIVA
MTETPDTGESDEFYPEFQIVRRGYDPEQVEQVLDDLYSTLDRAAKEARASTTALREAERARTDVTDALSEAERRIAELERRPSEHVNPSFDNIGTSVAQILQAATAEAAEIRRRANDEAQALHHESEAAAVTSRVETDHYAADLRARAESEAHAIVAQAREEADRLLIDARVRQESQERAAVEAHERRIVSLTAQIDALAAEVRQARGRAQTDADSAVAEAQATARGLVAEAQQYRRQVREEIASAHAQLVAAMTAAGLPAPERTIPTREPDGAEGRSDDESSTAPVEPPVAHEGALEPPEGLEDQRKTGASEDALEPDRARRTTAASSSGRR